MRLAYGPSGRSSPEGNHGLELCGICTSTVQFAIPCGALDLVAQYDIFGNATPIQGTTLSIGNSPVLLVSPRQHWR